MALLCERRALMRYVYAFFFRGRRVGNMYWTIAKNPSGWIRREKTNFFPEWLYRFAQNPAWFSSTHPLAFLQTIFIPENSVKRSTYLAISKIMHSYKFISTISKCKSNHQTVFLEVQTFYHTHKNTTKSMKGPILSLYFYQFANLMAL